MSSHGCFFGTAVCQHLLCSCMRTEQVGITQEPAARVSHPRTGHHHQLQIPSPVLTHHKHLHLQEGAKLRSSRWKISEAQRECKHAAGLGAGVQMSCDAATSPWDSCPQKWLSRWLRTQGQGSTAMPRACAETLHCPSVHCEC